MDLTPPSLVTSPQSSHRSLTASPPCPSIETYHAQISSSNYPSNSLTGFRYKLHTPPYGAADHHQDLSRTSLSQPAWTSSDTMVPVTSSAAPSSLPNILSAEYDPFANYELCINGPYDPHANIATSSHSHPPSTTSALSRTSSSASLMSRMPVPMHERAPVVYSNSQVPLSARVRSETPGAYSPNYTASNYSPTPSLPAVYASDATGFPMAQQQHGSGEPMYTWPKHEYDGSQLYPVPSSETASMPHDPRRQSTSMNRKRPTRKHTTREEANFQCEVKGCGKFFSRSYNFKSHMETHDVKREYPFPCTVSDCDKKFVRKTDLQRHHQSVHTKERNHRCDYCGRHFARKDTLRRHMEDGCSRRFDLGTLDLQAENQSRASSHSLSRSTPPMISSLGSGAGILPPMAVTSMSSVPKVRHGVSGEQGHLHSHSQVWGR
jgi:hypothetical protein